ncbi:MAG: IgGFc-binding protein [Deltaproteobacteria bacterium]|nr:IgGFc-binding protein [Deltaproteobacteria bacterium]
MRSLPKRLPGVLGVVTAFVLAGACSATKTTSSSGSTGEGGGGSGGSGGGLAVGAGGNTGCASATVCVGNSVHECKDGNPGAKLANCDGAKGEICSDGACQDACKVAEGSPSNLGCEFWAVDLPNERGASNASALPWGIVLANASDAKAKVLIERNAEPVGMPPSLAIVHDLEVGPGQLLALNMPTAEVTGQTPQTKEPPGPPGTFTSTNAFRIRSTAPIVAYQFNVFTNSYSNDATLLLPTNGLGKVYRVLGYPTANPIALFPDLLPTPPGIPDRSHVTVVAVEPDTEVTLVAGTTTAGNEQGFAPMKKGDSRTVKLGAFEVFNLASDGIPGDMTGTVVSANKPVAVFTSVERGIAPVVTDPPKPPDWTMDTSLCCTDHLEEQLFPASSMGKRFVVTRSPIRSTGGYKEPDELRFLGVAETAQVKTTLPPPLDNFKLEPGQVVDTYTFGDIVVESSAPIAIGQVQVSAAYTTTYLGDPSLTIFPPVEQYRDTYLFLIPSSWDKNFVVLGGPQGAEYTLDGKPLTGCVVTAVGPLEGTDYESLVCPVGEGAHRIQGKGAFGLTVYGYGSVGSYAYSGGADVEPIYEVPPIF